MKAVHNLHQLSRNQEQRMDPKRDDNSQGISNRETGNEEEQERKEHPPINPLPPDVPGVAGGSPGDESKEHR